MARIFLSYARDDAAKASALAACLERVGHSVWWDRHIHGGSEYSGEIETALRDADVILVLWSQSSIHSAWVRDEAAEGRDSGRLIPLLLDGSVAPLGFRQFQSISISGWSGRGNPPNFQEILTSIADHAGHEPVATEAPKFAKPTPPRPAIPALLAALGALLLLAIGGWWLIGGRGQASATPVVAVLPFSDLSPQRDKAYFAEGVAEAILTKLAKEPGIRVLGRSTAQQLQAAGDRSDEMRRALGVTHVVEGSARSIGNDLRMSVRLINASDGRQLWAEEYRRRLDNVFAVQDEIGQAVALRLKGSFSSRLQSAQQQTSTEAYTLYLAAKAKARSRELRSLKAGLELAKQVITADPNYAPGHALYAELAWHLASVNYGTIPEADARRLAQAHARRAIELAPNLADGHAALGFIGFGESAVKSLSRAVQLDPSRADIRFWLALPLSEVGRNAEGLEQVKAAVEIDPLLRPAVWNLTDWLAASMRFDDAEDVVRQYERRGGSRAVAAAIRARIACSYKADESEGIRLAHLALKLDPNTPLARDTLATAYDHVGLTRQASDYATDWPLYSRLEISGDYPRLVSRVREDGAEVWKQGEVWPAFYALARSHDWVTIERLYDERPQELPSLCTFHFYGQTVVMIRIALALQHRGRPKEASRLLACIKKSLAVRGGPVRPGTHSAAILDLQWAEIHALEGRPDRAFALLQRAVTRGFRTNYSNGMSELSTFDRYNQLPRYKAMDARLKQLIAQERAEVLHSNPRLTS